MYPIVAVLEKVVGLYRLTKRQPTKLLPKAKETAADENIMYKVDDDPHMQSRAPLHLSNEKTWINIYTIASCCALRPSSGCTFTKDLVNTSQK